MYWSPLRSPKACVKLSMSWKSPETSQAETVAPSRKLRDKQQYRETDRRIQDYREKLMKKKDEVRKTKLQKKKVNIKTKRKLPIQGEGKRN